MDGFNYPTVSKEPATYLPTQRGGKMLVDSLYYCYNIHKDGKDGRQYWVCSRNKTKKHPFCPGRAVTKDVSEIDHTVAHNHLSDKAAFLAKKVRSEILQAAEDHPTLQTAELVNTWAQQVSNPLVRIKSVKSDSIQRAIQRTKAKALEHPEAPQSFSDLEAIPDKYCQTFDGDKFLQINVKVDDEKEDRILVFASNHGLDYLRHSSTWSSDGTFRICPVPFYQAYFLMAELSGKSYPAAYCFLPDKKSGTYRKLFTELRQLLETSGPLLLNHWLIDFESAVFKEIWTVFGGKSKVRVSGCHVHFRRNLRKRLGHLGLLSVANKNMEFHGWINCIAALAYLPAEEIQTYYTELVQEGLPKAISSIQTQIAIGQGDWDEAWVTNTIETLLEGLEATYIGRKLRTGGFGTPRFEPEVWSHHESIQNLGQRTTNRNEVLNSVFAKALPANATIWKVVDQIKSFEAKVRIIRNERMAQTDILADPEDQATAGSKGDRIKRRSLQDIELRNLMNQRQSFASKVEFLKELTKFSAVELD